MGNQVSGDANDVRTSLDHPGRRLSRLPGSRGRAARRDGSRRDVRCEGRRVRRPVPRSPRRALGYATSRLRTIRRRRTRRPDAHDDGRQEPASAETKTQNRSAARAERGGRRSGHSRRKRVGVDGDTRPGRRQRPVYGFHHPHHFDAETARRTRLDRLVDRVAEVPQLDRKWLRGIDARRHDVTRPVGQPELAERLRFPEVDARVEDANRLVRRVVVDDHLLATRRSSFAGACSGPATTARRGRSARIRTRDR